MLARLGHDAVVGGDDHQVEVDAGRAGDHRAHEALVAGRVDDREAAPARQAQRRVAELDRDPARLLRGQAVGVPAGQRGDERGLAVVDVAGRAERERRRGRHPRAARTAAAAWSASSSVSVRTSSSRRPSAMRPTSGGSPARSGCGQGRRSSGRPPGRAARAAAARRRRPWPSRRRPRRRSRSASRRARASSARGSAVEHRQHRQLGARELGVAVQRQRRLERGERELVDAHRAGQRVAPARLDRLAACRPAAPPCGPPRSLSPLKQTTAAPARTERRTAGSSASSSRSSASTPEPTSSTTGTPRPHSASISTSSVKPRVRKFDGCARRMTPVRSPSAAA